MTIHIGVDLGGTKLFVAALDEHGVTHASSLRATPRHDYASTINAITEMVTELETKLSLQLAPVGIGMPGSIIPDYNLSACSASARSSYKQSINLSGLVQNANSTWLNGKNFKADICDALNREVRLQNDANCFALSEAIDGAAAGASSVFGVILGTGVGGGLVQDGRIINGPRSIGGEWGHCSLPFPSHEELDGAQLCWCGQKGCIESWLSGPAICRHHNRSNNIPDAKEITSVEEIVELAASGDLVAQKNLAKHAERLARALSMIVNIYDPEVIVLGGGLSQLHHLYEQLPLLMQTYIFSDVPLVDIRPPKFGATSGVRGAARLWGF